MQFISHMPARLGRFDHALLEGLKIGAKVNGRIPYPAESASLRAARPDREQTVGACWQACRGARLFPHRRHAHVKDCPGIYAVEFCACRLRCYTGPNSSTIKSILENGGSW